MLVLRQHSQLDLFFQHKVGCTHCLSGTFTLQIKPNTRGLRDDAGLILRDQIIVFIHRCAVAADGTCDAIPLPLHGELLTAAGTPVQQIMHVLGHLAVAVICDPFLLVPGVVIMLDSFMQPFLNFFRRERFQFLCCEEHVHNDFHLAAPLIQTILGIGEVTSGDAGYEHRNAAALQKLGRPQRHRLIGTGNAAHTLRKDTDPSTGLQNPTHFTDAVQVRHKILLGNHLQ